VEFGLLGPLVVRAGGSPVVVSAGKQRVLLAALLLRADQVVPAAELAGFLWEGSPPGSARVTINGVNALDDTSQCVCAWLGVVTVMSPGQSNVTTE